MEKSIEFRNLTEMWVEDDRPPFGEVFLGKFEKDHEGYFRFHPSVGVVMTCKHLRSASEHASALNMSAEELLEGPV